MSFEAFTFELVRSKFKCPQEAATPLRKLGFGNVDLELLCMQIEDYQGLDLSDEITLDHTPAQIAKRIHPRRETNTVAYAQAA